MFCSYKNLKEFHLTFWPINNMCTSLKLNKIKVSMSSTQSHYIIPYGP